MKLKVRKKRALMLGSMVLAGAGTNAAAQEIKTSLPLTSIGSDLAWTVGDQNLSLDVPVSGHVRLELYSARLDQKDYRGDNYYGDEQYDANKSQVATTFSLVDAQGKVVLTKTYQPGAHNWDTFLDMDLPAGKYVVKASTDGNGKNTFALRLSGISAAVNADNLTVNVHSQEWLAAINVATDGEGYALRMYDGDGSKELEARLRDEAGNIYPMPVSGERDWATLKLPDRAGHYTLELRQPATAKQFSNTVGFALTRQGVAAPITLSKVDQTGLLKVTAQLVLPTGTVPTQAAVTVQGQDGVMQLPVDDTLQRQVRAGDYTVQVQDIPGATVTIDKTGVNVPKDGMGEVLVQVKPQVALSLQTDKTEVCMGDVVNVVARASSAFQGELPLNLQMQAQGLNFTGAQPDMKTLKPGEQAEWHLEATATQAGTFSLQANLPDWKQSQQATVKVLPNATALQLRREPLGASRIGDTVTVTLSLTNTTQEEVPYKLTDQPGEGLQATQDTTFSGTLKPGEVRTLSYTAKVVGSGDISLNANLDTPSCPMPQQSQAVMSVAAPVAPTVERRSSVKVPFDVPRQATEVVVEHEPPVGAKYVPGSAKLDGNALPDPLVGAKGALYWVLPSQVKGTVTYDLAHSGMLGALPQPGLMIRLAGERSEVLQGKVDAADLQNATLMMQDVADGAENAGAIKLPLDNKLIRLRDRINVTVEAPLGATAPTLMVNGKAMSTDLIGETTQDGPRGVQRITYVAVPIDLGPNTINFGSENIHVMRVGPATQLEVTPINMVADGSTPVRLKVRALDAYGNLSSLSKLTVGTNLEPYVADADTGESGYQMALKNGEGILTLQPQSAPTSLDLSIELDRQLKTYKYQVTPDLHAVGVGMISATLGVHSGFSIDNDLTWQGRGYSENPIGAGKLYIAADKDGLPYTDDKTPLQRYSVYGDASTESVPLQGIDPIAAVYDHPAFQMAYRRMQMPVNVLPVGDQFTAFTATTKMNPVVSGFVAGIPSDQVNEKVIVPDGTRMLHLPNGEIADGSDTLQLVTYDKNGGKELGRKLLVRNTDYILDQYTGIVTFTRSVDPFDYDFNTVRILASYRLDGADSERKMAYGIQVQQKTDHYTIGAAVVRMDDKTTFGVRGTYDRDDTHGQLAVAYASGVQASADYTSKWGNRWGHTDMALLTARYQSDSYDGLGSFSAGLNLNAKYVAGITSAFVAIAEAEYHSTPTLNTVNNTLTPDDIKGGSVTVRGDYHLDPFSVGAGVKYAYGDIYGVGAVGSIGYHAKPFDIDVVHTQSLSGNLNNETDIAARYHLTDHTSLGVKDQIIWGMGQAVSLQLDMALGNVNYAVGYDLPNAAGTGNRARFGVTTSVPLSSQLAMGLHGSALYDVAAQTTEGAAGADFNYKSDNYSATIGGDVVHTDKGWGTVARAGITGSLTTNLVVTADGLGEFGAGKSGERVNLGYAYRNNTINSLGYLRYLNGTLAGSTADAKLLWGLSAEYRQPSWGVRAGVDTRTLLNDSGSFTAQYYLSGKYYLTDYLAVGAWAHMFSQPSTNTNLYGYGIEGSVRPLPGIWLSAGYNLKGFDSVVNIPNIYTRKGMYLRVDLTLDETLGKGAQQ